MLIVLLCKKVKFFGNLMFFVDFDLLLIRLLVKLFN